MRLVIWGLILNFVVGVGSGLAVQPIQRWWEKRASSSRAKRIQRIQEEYDETIYFALQPEFLLGKLILIGIGVSCYAVYVLLLVKLDVTPFSSSAWSWHTTFTFPRYVLMLLDVANVMFIVFLTTFVGRIAFNAFALFERVRTFKRYVNKVPSEVRDLQLEKVVIAIVMERPLSPVSREGMKALLDSLNKERGTNDDRRHA
jgi:hypothetical protein